MMPLARRIQVLDDDKRHAAVPRHVPQKLLQGFQSPGGGADAYAGSPHTAARLR
jgi:hypothetical protein